MERRAALRLAVGAAGALVGACIATEPAAAATDDQPASAFLEAIAATAAEYRALLTEAPNMDAWQAFRQLEYFHRHYQVSAGAHNYTVDARTEAGLLNLRFTVSGSSPALQQLSSMLDEQYPLQQTAEGVLALIVRAIPDNRPVLHLFVRVVGIAA